MNKILLALSLVASAAAHAQLDRSIRPTAAPARTPTIAQYQKFQLQNGLTVLLVEDHKLPSACSESCSMKAPRPTAKRLLTKRWTLSEPV